MAATLSSLLSFPSQCNLNIRTKPSFLTPKPLSHPKSSSLFTPLALSTSQNPTVLSKIAKGAALFLAGTVFLAAVNRKPALALDDAMKVNLVEAKFEDETEANLVEEKFEDETEMYARLVEQDPSDLESLKSLVYGKMKKGKVEEAMKYVERLIAAEPDEVEWRLLKALSFELMGKYNVAKRLFKEILAKRPLHIRALHGLALAMLKNREGSAAFNMLNKALDLARRENRITEERNIKILIAQLHIVKGDLEGATKRFQELINENPHDFRPYLCQGIIYSLLERNMEADEQFELYRSLVPHEFPQRKLIDDAILTAKMEYQEYMKQCQSQGSPQK